jgi:hypothetical protein
MALSLIEFSGQKWIDQAPDEFQPNDAAIQANECSCDGLRRPRAQK